MKRNFFDSLEQNPTGSGILDKTKGILHQAYEATADFVGDVVNGPDAGKEANSVAGGDQSASQDKSKNAATAGNDRQKESATAGVLRSTQEKLPELAAKPVDTKLNVLEADTKRTTAELLGNTELGTRLGVEALKEYGPKLDYMIDKFFEGMLPFFGPTIRESLRSAFLITMLQGLADDSGQPAPTTDPKEEKSASVGRMDMFQTMTKKNKTVKAFANSFLSGVSPLLRIAGLGGVLKKNITMRSNFSLQFEQAYAADPKLIDKDGIIGGHNRGLSILDNPGHLAAYLKANKYSGYNYGSELWPSDKQLELKPMINSLFAANNGLENIKNLAAAVSGKLSDPDIETLKLGLTKIEGTARTIDGVKAFLDKSGIAAMLKPLASWLSNSPFAGLVARFFGNSDGEELATSDNIVGDQAPVYAQADNTPTTDLMFAGAAITHEDAVAKYGSTGAVKNFNPGNMRVPGSADFQTFETPALGFSALVNFIRNKQQGAIGSYTPTMTLTEYMGKYAPKGDGDNDPVAYANNIAAFLKIPVETQLKDIDPVKLAIAHAKFEDANSFQMLNDLNIINAEYLTANVA